MSKVDFLHVGLVTFVATTCLWMKKNNILMDHFIVCQSLHTNKPLAFKNVNFAEHLNLLFTHTILKQIVKKNLHYHNSVEWIISVDMHYRSMNIKAWNIAYKIIYKMMSLIILGKTEKINLAGGVIQLQ